MALLKLCYPMCFVELVKSYDSLSYYIFRKLKCLQVELRAWMCAFGLRCCWFRVLKVKVEKAFKGGGFKIRGLSEGSFGLILEVYCQGPLGCETQHGQSGDVNSSSLCLWISTLGFRTCSKRQVGNWRTP